MNAPIAPGSKAPAIDLEGTQGRVRLDDLRGKPVILAFYPADWSPVCGDQMALYNEVLSEFQAHGAARQEKGPLVFALVQHVLDLGKPDDGALDGQRAVDHETLLAVYDVAARDAGARVGVPGSRITEDDRHGHRCFGG